MLRLGRPSTGPQELGREAGDRQGRAAPLLTVAVPPDELVQAGWEKCWSKRENRPYYFNRFTNQSLWEMPVLGQHDVIVSTGPSQGAASIPGRSAGQTPGARGLQSAPVGGSSLPLAEPIVCLGFEELFLRQGHAQAVLVQVQSLLREHSASGAGFHPSESKIKLTGTGPCFHPCRSLGQGSGKLRGFVTFLRGVVAFVWTLQRWPVN